MPLRALHSVEEIRRQRSIHQPRRPMWRKRLPRQLPPNGIVLEYYKFLRSVLERAYRMVRDRVIPALPRIVAQAAAERGDAAMRLDREELNKLVDQISKDFFEDLRPDELERRARAFAYRTSDYQREQLRKQTRAAFGVDVFHAEPQLAGRVADFTAENVALIKSIPNKFLDDVEATVTRGVRQGLRHEDLAKEIEKRYQVSRDRAALIARDQTLSFYGSVNRARQEAIGVKRFVWRSVNDGRVRPEHEDRDGETFEWDDPPDGETPGSPVNCRCWAEPDFSEILDKL